MMTLLGTRKPLTRIGGESFRERWLRIQSLYNSELQVSDFYQVWGETAYYYETEKRVELFLFLLKLKTFRKLFIYKVSGWPKLYCLTLYIRSRLLKTYQLRFARPSFYSFSMYSIWTCTFSLWETLFGYVVMAKILIVRRNLREWMGWILGNAKLK